MNNTFFTPEHIDIFFALLSLFSWHYIRQYRPFYLFHYLFNRNRLSILAEKQGTEIINQLSLLHTFYYISTGITIYRITYTFYPTYLSEHIVVFISFFIGIALYKITKRQIYLLTGILTNNKTTAIQLLLWDKILSSITGIIIFLPAFFCEFTPYPFNKYLFYISISILALSHILRILYELALTYKHIFAIHHILLLILTFEILPILVFGKFLITNLRI